MRLISLHIDNFGNLSDFDLVFDRNPMVVFKENGWGKSTLAAFIKVMFYGFANELKKNSTEREREKYRPWKGGTYGGTLTYEAEGKQYLISKSFGERSKEDSCSVTDLTTGLIAEDKDPLHMGQELFALDERSFLRSVFIAQNDVRVHEDGHEDIADGISAKIGNLSDATDDVNRYEAVMERLNDVLNRMSPKRATGSLKQMSAHISSLQNTLRGEEALKDATQRLELQLQKEQENLQHLKDERAAIDERFMKNAQQGELLARKEAFQQLWDQYEEARESLEKTEQSYVNGLPVEEEVTKKLEEWTERNALEHTLENNELQLNHLISDAEQAKARAREQLEAAKREYRLQEESVEKTRRTAIILLAIALILLVAGAMTVFVLSRLEVGIGIVGSGVCSLLMGLIVILVAASNKRKLKYYRVDEEAYEKVMHDENADIAQLNARIASDRDRMAIIETNVEEFLRHYQFTYEPQTVEKCLYEIRQRIALLKAKVEEVEQKREEIRKYENANDMTSIMNADPELAQSAQEDLGRERGENDERFKEVRESIRMYMHRLEENMEELQNMSDMRLELENLKETYDTNLHKYEMLTMTRDYLKIAKQNFSAKYRRPLLDGFKKYYSRLSAEEVSEFQLDANIHMTRRAFGEARDVEAYSSGDRDLVDICLRMALVDAMYQDEKPFVVLDDPFVNLDRKRCDRALQFLSEVAKDYQVIYFTCHEART
ncbi:MAG: AAA family ATPase [Lachnospiraceae bacterium]|nr:AAA family ATPase [Lachnospiraceae bacterium]